MNTIQIDAAYTDAFRQLADPAAQCDYLIQLGMGQHSTEEIHRDEYRIGGCKTAIWMKTVLQSGRIHITADSDSLLVKGLLAILEELYQGSTPAEVAAHPPRFIAELQDEVIYPEIKQNGILKCYQRIKTTEPVA